MRFAQKMISLYFDNISYQDIIIHVDITYCCQGTGFKLVHCCAIFLCEIDDHHRNPNNNDRDHLVGQLTRFSPAPSLEVKSMST